jgi:hypothetical protein
MTKISSSNLINNLTSSQSPTTSITASTEDRAATQSAAPPQPSTVVTLGQTSRDSLQTYSILGLSANAASSVTWASNPSDPVSKLMAENYLNQALGNRLNGLGSALLDQFGSTGANFSQSVQVGSANSISSPGPNAGGSQAGIALTIKMASGVEVDVTLDSQGNELSVSAQSNGELSDTERSALENLSGAFQSAINGLSASPPSLDLSGLTQFDSSVISSVTLHSSVTNDDQQTQTIDLVANNSARTVSVTGPTGTLKVSVDTSDLLIGGNQKQRTEAIDEYLKQFDQENARGHGDASLMAMFKDAFAQMNGADGDPSQSSPDTVYSQSVSGIQGAMLTGLDDFTASISDTPVASNPMLPDETDTFSYQVSQQTDLQGNPLTGAISQQQQSHLSASYHMALSSQTPLLLTKELKSQNYSYMQVNDSANSTTHLAYQNGQITQASLNQSASQSTERSTYLWGKLVADTTTPSESSKTSDLLALLKPLLQDSQESRNTTRWQQALSDIHDQIFLQAVPVGLNGST